MIDPTIESKHKNIDIEVGFRINNTWNKALYIQMISSFASNIDFIEFTKYLTGIRELFEESSEKEILSKLSQIENKLNRLVLRIEKKFPSKKTYDEIAYNWNNNFKEKPDFLSYGLKFGWLDNYVCMDAYNEYDYTPYHFNVGMMIHKGKGEIEENFLLHDSFTCLIKANKLINKLDHIGHTLKSKNKSVSNDTMDLINAIKYEISFYCRNSCVSFFSFLEAFVNSIGCDFSLRNLEKLNEKEVEILNGKKNGRFLSLKVKMEKFQKIIRNDLAYIPIVLSDENQLKQPFKELFNEYEELRNSAVHYSPQKNNIWLKPHDWFEKAKRVSELVIMSALEYWKICHNSNIGPDYLGRLDYVKLYKLAEKREKLVSFELNSISGYKKST